MTDWRPRLLALDVDGTLVTSDNRMSAEVRAAVRALHQQGMEIVIATGRAVPGVYDVTRRLGIHDGYAVCSNGSIVFSYDPFTVMRAVTFDASDAVRRVLERVPEALVAVEEIGVGYRLNRPFPEGEISGTMTIQEVDELIAEPVTRVVIRSPEHSSDDFHALVADLGLHDTNYYIGYTAWLDIAPEGVSKASGLQVVCDRLGLAADDVLAVGDGMNDLEMLAWAGHGVAMGHAPEAVRHTADSVTDGIDADGLLPVLRRWLD